MILGIVGALFITAVLLYITGAVWAAIYAYHVHVGLWGTKEVAYSVFSVGVLIGLWTSWLVVVTSHISITVS